uniref:EF-hand domain-containing protein n=1 Tax=Equus asinus TaxID=9793 RepID=A0A9L0JRH7_EQUAS
QRRTAGKSGSARERRAGGRAGGGGGGVSQAGATRGGAGRGQAGTRSLASSPELASPLPGHSFGASFHSEARYAGKDGNSSKLSKTEFLTFMNRELAAFTKNQKDPGVLDRMMKKLDLNADGQLDFQEFLNLIGGLAIACHESFLKSAHSQK